MSDLIDSSAIKLAEQVILNGDIAPKQVSSQSDHSSTIVSELNLSSTEMTNVMTDAKLVRINGLSDKASLSDILEALQFFGVVDKWDSTIFNGSCRVLFAHTADAERYVSIYKEDYIVGFKDTLDKTVHETASPIVYSKHAHLIFVSREDKTNIQEWRTKIEAIKGNSVDRDEYVHHPNAIVEAMQLFLLNIDNMLTVDYKNAKTGEVILVAKYSLYPFPSFLCIQQTRTSCANVLFTCKQGTAKGFASVIFDCLINKDKSVCVRGSPGIGKSHILNDVLILFTQHLLANYQTVWYSPNQYNSNALSVVYWIDKTTYHIYVTPEGVIKVKHYKTKSYELLWAAKEIRERVGHQCVFFVDFLVDEGDRYSTMFSISPVLFTCSDYNVSNLTRGFNECGASLREFIYDLCSWEDVNAMAIAELDFGYQCEWAAKENDKCAAYNRLVTNIDVGPLPRFCFNNQDCYEERMNDVCTGAVGCFPSFVYARKIPETTSLCIGLTSALGITSPLYRHNTHRLVFLSDYALLKFAESVFSSEVIKYVQMAQLDSTVMSTIAKYALVLQPPSESDFDDNFCVDRWEACVDTGLSILLEHLQYHFSQLQHHTRVCTGELYFNGDSFITSAAKLRNNIVYIPTSTHFVVDMFYRSENEIFLIKISPSTPQLTIAKDQLLHLLKDLQLHCEDNKHTRVTLVYVVNITQQDAHGIKMENGVKESKNIRYSSLLHIKQHMNTRNVLTDKEMDAHNSVIITEKSNVDIERDLWSRVKSVVVRGYIFPRLNKAPLKPDNMLSYHELYAQLTYNFVGSGCSRSLIIEEVMKRLQATQCNHLELIHDTERIIEYVKFREVDEFGSDYDSEADSSVVTGNKRIRSNH